MQRAPAVALVGHGHWGKNIARNLAELGALGALVEAQPEAQARAREAHPDTPLHDSLDAVLASPDLDAVMIATPAETHYELARRSLEAGKDVFVEKPMTTDEKEARELVALARARERILMVGHLLEYHPAITRLHELVRSGEMGKIRYVISNRLALGKMRSEENALWSFAPHDISVVLRLVDRMPFEVVATGGCYIQANVADVTVTQLLFDNGVRSHIFVSWLHPFKEQKLVVIGSRKMATYDDLGKELLLYDLRVDWDRGEPVPERTDGVPVPFARDEPLRLECEHFLACVRTREEPRTDGLAGLRVLQILRAAQRSMITNGTPVALAEHDGHAGEAASSAPEAGRARVRSV